MSVEASIVEEIDRALGELGTPVSEIRKLDAPSSAEIAEQIRSAFVEGNPSFWWAALRRRSKSTVYEANKWEEVLRQWLAPIKDARCWFVPEFQIKPVVYDAALSEALVEAVSCCRDFYLVGQRLDWLLAGTHHDALIMALPAEHPSP